MIQFLGLNLGSEQATATIIARRGRITQEADARIMNAVRDESAQALEVPVAEWVRAGAYALQEAYFKLAVADRKVWGLGLAGPNGWILLDIAFEPLSPLRLTGDLPFEDDLHRWLEANPRLAKKATMLLSPKDYFRFIISGGLVADASSASRAGLLEQGRTEWSVELALEKRIKTPWLPPVFNCHVMTGRLSEEGMRRTSLPGGLWLVAGAHEIEAGIIGAGNLRDGKLWTIHREGQASLQAIAVPHLREIVAAPGWQVVRSPYVGQQLAVKNPAVDASQALTELKGFGIEAAGTASGTANPALGAACLAAIGSNLVGSWDQVYKGLGSTR